MDNYPTSWAPRPALVVLAWSVTALLLAGVVTDAVFGDGKGAVLMGVALLAVAGFAAHWSLVRPRLAVDAEGLVARTLGGTHRLPWDRTSARLRTTRRMGRDGVTLELEHGDELYVFGRLDLGEDPRDVMDVLSARRGAR
ncbi:PH domain-containing protein [Amycolatopsis sp. PS_44_ISF1]|uniref:PH domain-containing protein n=1 Tax=Amycolatopsis sp. PS_44_ISF1 TaxID=2974917 RepID=UPI0028DD56DE|nr:PH domain-containing protein [Amycolatopsis sp. PS_44_ISF1]MDT8910425.1 PH domain-containing protein [Amycolatopsis sp. PS_44_ISF1]